MVRPRKLQKGDTIATLSPSWGGPSVFPHIYQAGIKTLEELGLKVKEYPSVKKDSDYIYNNPKFRAEDINNAFEDPEVKGIFSTIGGEDSIRILKYLDTESILKNPKIFMGYSDTTTINTYLNQLGLVTFNGPSIMAGFAQWDTLGEEFKSHIRTFLFDNLSEYEYKPYSFYCEGYPDWSNKENVGKVNEKKENNGWDWLQGDSVVRGELFGGCIEVFQFFKSTQYWPSDDFWDNKILFFETSEHKPSPEEIKWILRNYGVQGVFEKVNALLFGRPRDYTKKEKEELKKHIMDIVEGEFGASKLTTVTNMDFGHTDPQWILPLGINAELDCNKKTFKLIEKMFAD